MHFSTFCGLVLFSCGLVVAQSDSTANVTQAFSQAHIVPGVIPVFAPVATLGVVFSDNSTGQQLNVTPGVNLTEAQTAREPQFFLNSSNSTLLNQTFVLTIVDPDALTPQNPSLAQFRHFLSGGFRINGTTNGTLLVNVTAALSDFIPPTPPAGSDPHRYIVLVFAQPPTFEDDSRAIVNSSTPRQNFNITAFAQTAQLGSPIAGNFFFTGPGDNSTGGSASGTAGGSQPSSTAPSAGSNGAFEVTGNLLRALVPTGLLWFIL
ncbi:hypothetical protein HGRIS_009389 [Hohenbuehelia grisea]|uniref:PEBP-like protein n=1 Tax=Hohenbuehelia grisea TaxID=104357 RepID=A0ABR3J1B7_9AGAR